jgi:hypothetical protein
MNRTFLLAAVSIAPLLVIAPGAAMATDTISTATSTPVATATATSNGPDDISISSSGSIGLTASGVAVTINSNNTVTNAGQIGATAIDNVVGIQAQGGHTGSITNDNTINVTDNYSPTDTNNDGLIDGAFAQGTNRIGIQVVGASPFVGDISNLGTITVHGDNSAGVSIEAPITGSFRSLLLNPASGTTAATLTQGSIAVLGDNSVGFQITPTGAVGGDLTLSGVSATGVNTRAVVIGGSVGGAATFSGAIQATGYRTTQRSNFPSLSTLATAQELSTGGPAVTIGANVGGGVIVSAPPLLLSTTNLDLDGNGIPDTLQSAASIVSYGSAPAMVFGAAGGNVTIGLLGAGRGVVGEGGAGAYGFVNQGTITGAGVFDQLNYPNLPAPAPGTGIQVGVAGGGSTVIQGGIYNTGVIGGQAFQANATAIHFLAGAATPLILNDAVITGTATQVNSATTGVTPLAVYGVLIEPGASVSSVVNNGSLVANITGTGGVGGTVGALIDRSGTLASVTNTGSLSAQLTQTLVSAPMPGIATAIDMSLGTGPQIVSQSANPAFASTAAYDTTLTYSQGAIVNYNGLIYQAVSAASPSADPVDFPSFWRQIGAQSPFIHGSVLFGSGGSTLDVAAGAVLAPVLQMGTGVNTINVHGAAGAGVTGATVTGGVEEGPAIGGGNSTLTINVDNGTLSDTNPNPITARAVNIGANGLLLVSADPAHGTNTDFITSGASSFAQGAQVGLTLQSIPNSLTQTYTVLETVPGQGTLTAGTFAAGLLDNAPFLFTADASFAPAADPATQSSKILLTVQRKSAAQLGFNAAEGAALDAVLAAAPANNAISSALLAQTSEAGLKSVYDQLLPDQGQGLFEALAGATQAISSLTGSVPDPTARVTGTNLWLQEVNERVKRDGVSTIGSLSKLVGLVGGYEVSASGGGSVGLTLAYLNTSEQNSSAPIGAAVQSSTLEVGAYYRREAGHLSGSLRVGGGYSWLQDRRKFVTTGAALAAQSNWGALFYDAHAQVGYEQHLGRYYARPELSVDYLGFDEGSHTDTGGGPGFDLHVASRNSSRLSGQALMVLGREWGTPTAWVRTEIRGGFREILAGSVGDTTANFDDGSPFTLAAENDRGGWATFGFSVKTGSQYSYLAFEGDADLRASEQRYDLRIAGRSLF